MLNIKISNSDLNITLINRWKAHVMNRIHNIMRDREVEILPPPLNRHLKDHELSDDEGRSERAKKSITYRNNTRTMTETLPNTQWSHAESSTLRTQPNSTMHTRHGTTKRISPDSQQTEDLPSSSKRSPPPTRNSPKSPPIIIKMLDGPNWDTLTIQPAQGAPSLIRMNLATLIAATETNTGAMADPNVIIVVDGSSLTYNAHDVHSRTTNSNTDTPSAVQKTL